MTEEYKVIDDFDYKNEPCKLIENIETEERYSTENDLEANSLCELLNKQNETIKKQNQEILACHDTLVTIEALCDAVINYDFKDVTDKIDFCNMLNEIDDIDLKFLKECFTAIRGNDLKKMTKLTVECMDDIDD